MEELIIQAGDREDAPFAVFIMGPTATGKTDLAIACAEQFDMDIISVDSALVYRDMDIGTAKPDVATLLRVPHKLVDIIDPAESYSAGRFREEALLEMESSTAAGKVPCLAGGTMLYFNTLQKGIANLPDTNPEIRQRLLDEAEQKGIESMHARLAEVDPESAQRLHPNDPQRVLRALEVFEISGKTLTAHWAEQSKHVLPYHVIKLALVPPDRIELRKRIEQRFDAMLVGGLIDEVRSFYQRGDLSLEMPSMRAVGYRQVWMYLTGQYDYDTMREKAITATAQLAKRQMTWLRSEEDCNFINPETLNVGKVLKNLKFLL
ncbi:MAG: tRNA (adenosine(37)-N6)-dimethylallyltransferase MiaA [Gammaproteobacteria bacterium]|nr:tRNA (adenosine(37)-N6)-dimethylallyltransferase MiaA [Gammaproteobacteria bacterium]MCK5263457.1 tRNA (adenosine(37)-N6)-dimethylallyltransferase MiaA [Gammaproteobacteria bacterium]